MQDVQDERDGGKLTNDIYNTANFGCSDGVCDHFLTLKVLVTTIDALGRF